MIKTLKITCIFSAILAIGVLILLIIFGLRSDAQIEKFLDLPGIVDSFMAQAGKPKRSKEQVSPLVKQARAFANLINPPKPKVKAPVKKTPARTRPKPKTVTAKFKLIGTCFYPNNTQMSWALLDEVGKGLRWAKQSSKVGHLIIEEVKDGIVVVKDGDRTFEMVAERPQKKSLLQGASSSRKKAARTSSIIPSRTVQPVKVRSPDVTPTPTVAKISVQETERSLKFIREIMSDPEAMGISPEEAKELGDLGKLLKDVEQELKTTLEDGDRPAPEKSLPKTTPDSNNSDTPPADANE